MCRPEIEIDDVTYEIHIDHEAEKNGEKKYFIKSGFPFFTETKRLNFVEAHAVARSMRQLGFTIESQI